MEIKIDTKPTEAIKAPTEIEPIIPTVPNVKKEIVPKIHGKITTLLKEYEVSKWDEVEVFYGLIEKWIGNMVKDKTVSMPFDLLLLDSHNDIVKKNLHRYLQEQGENK